MKKVLIITYYWPPSAGAGVQRWLKFAKYLPSNSWNPIIFTPKNPSFKVKDVSLQKDVSNDLEVCKIPIWEPYSLKDRIFGKSNDNQSIGIVAKKNSFKNYLLNWVRGNIFIPDPKVFWVRPSVKFLKSKIKEEGIEHIITTGPPHSMHLIGLSLKKIFPKVKWIADFRDPWSQLDLLKEFHLSSHAKRKHQELEYEVLQNSDLILSVSETWVNDLKRLGARNVELITNGYDSDDFNISPKSNNKFIIGHYGLLNHLRNPINLWKCLEKLCNENSNFNSQLEIHLSGNIDSSVLDDLMKYSALKNKVRNFGYLSHEKVLEHYHSSNVLLLLLFNSESGKGNYPGKIFEYFAAQKPILAFGPNNSDTQFLINKTNSGYYFSYDSQEIKNDILMLFKERKILKNNDLDKFSRKNITKRLSHLLNNL
jgi:hypothetical protein